MSDPQRGRQQWEYADGPAVGEDVPITSEPREEEQPGVPREPDTADQSSGEGHDEREEREVEAEHQDVPPGTTPREN